MTATAIAPEAPAIDLQNLYERCVGNIELVQRVLDIFEPQFTQDLDQLEELHRAAQYDAFQRLAHRMKGSASNVAAVSLAQKLSEVERYSEEGSIHQLNELMEQLQHEWSRFLAALK